MVFTTSRRFNDHWSVVQAILAKPPPYCVLALRANQLDVKPRSNDTSSPGFFFAQLAAHCRISAKSRAMLAKLDYAQFRVMIAPLELDARGEVGQLVLNFLVTGNTEPRLLDRPFGSVLSKGVGNRCHRIVDCHRRGPAVKSKVLRSARSRSACCRGPAMSTSALIWGSTSPTTSAQTPRAPNRCYLDKRINSSASACASTSPGSASATPPMPCVAISSHQR